MVDFNKHLAGKKVIKPIDPVELYQTLDRAHDKGPLRPAQESVLTDWYTNHRNEHDVIVKLHTGQGKTLIGLLMLQSVLNNSNGPALYMCPNNFLIDQTCEQAKQFGIHVCKAEKDLPDDFLNGKKILVTSVQKLFNGLTRFGLFQHSKKIEALLMDDAHACADCIRESCRIRIEKTEPLYSTLLQLFEDELQKQGKGTFADICNEKREAFLPIPYWAWIEREDEIAHHLSKKTDHTSIKFAWPLLKDMLSDCQCVISGSAIEIEPYIPPLEAFGSYWKAKHRIFMSATVTDDAFLVKGLQLQPKTILEPLTYSKESWSGEKMILLPSLIHESLDRDWIVKRFGVPNKKRTSGIVVLAPSFSGTKDWHNYKSIIAEKENFREVIDRLKGENYENTIVLANRYDGIDLPDDTCRILIFDNKPYSENLYDLYQEFCRPDSEATLMRTIRSVEQGMGRSVRGEKDFSVIIITGSEITRLVREKHSHIYLSSQMKTQINIGIQIAELSQQEINNGETPENAFNNLINQCLQRDEGWKTFYSGEMKTVTPSGANKDILEVYKIELDAEQKCIRGEYLAAADVIQQHMDNQTIPENDKGWYLQEMARYLYRADKLRSLELQRSSHKANRLLLKPTSGVSIEKLILLSQNRMENIIKWVTKFNDYSEMEIILSDILDRLTFGVKADKFEHALDELSRALGFAGERPDKEWKEGPDNLWVLETNTYILWECKNEVDLDRTVINKRETEQMNRSTAWFSRHYPGAKVKNIIIHPVKTLESAAAFIEPVEVMRKNDMSKLKNRIREFFNTFEAQNFGDLSVNRIQAQCVEHKITVDDLLNTYTVKSKLLERNK